MKLASLSVAVLSVGPFIVACPSSIDPSISFDLFSSMLDSLTDRGVGLDSLPYSS